MSVGIDGAAHADAQRAAPPRQSVEQQSGCPVSACRVEPAYLCAARGEERERGAAQAEQRLVDAGPHAAAPDESACFFVGLPPGNVAQYVGRLKGALVVAVCPLAFGQPVGAERHAAHGGEAVALGAEAKLAAEAVGGRAVVEALPDKPAVRRGYLGVNAEGGFGIYADGEIVARLRHAAVGSPREERGAVGVEIVFVGLPQPEIHKAFNLLVPLMAQPEVDEAEGAVFGVDVAEVLQVVRHGVPDMSRCERANLGAAAAPGVHVQSC